MKRFLALLAVLLIVALLVLFLQASIYVYAAPKEDSSGEFSPDYVIQKMREEAGVSGSSVSWSSFGKRLVDGAVNVIRWLRKVAVLPLLVVIIVAGLMLIFGFIWSFTKLVRWAATVIAAAIAGWLLIQIAPLIVVWLSSLFSA
ncbi:MAG: hypothetical protein PWQ86_1949 [Bacillota bacterium]|jgi:hypothetical protein|nr:hypothetical protein [Bacillota bacterium]